MRFIVVVFLLLNTVKGEFVVPDAKIEVLRPKGFRVSIPVLFQLLEDREVRIVTGM
ncbi:unnamed protein product, partial [Callosobruchus maculatus]